MTGAAGVLGILQARTSSSRLPGKVLMPILGIPMLSHQLRRLSRCRRWDRLVVATSGSEADDPVARLAREAGLDCFRGSLGDVLDRYYHAALGYSPEHVVRVTGDCPLADPGVVDRAVDLHLESGADYTTNALEPTWPHGLDVEVFRFRCLEEAWREAGLPSQREHVTPFINRQPDRYRIMHLRNGIDLSGHRWTVDHPEDFEFVRRIYEALYPVDPDFGTEAILELVRREPYLLQVNKGFRRYEGLEKSFEEDRKAREGRG